MKIITKFLKNIKTKNKDNSEETISPMKLRSTYPINRADFIPNSMTPGDRKRFWDNFNDDLYNKISEIKSRNS